jgi:uncharacterized phage-associated protein
MPSCHNIADYFLTLCDEDAGDLISNLKMQKLLYYAQGFHLAMFNEPLFHEPIYAWTHGPVVAEAYARFKQYGSGPIPRPTEIDHSAIDVEKWEFLDEVYNVFGQYSAWKLRNMTHDEPPWKNTPSMGVISHESLAEYFKTQTV